MPRLDSLLPWTQSKRRRDQKSRAQSLSVAIALPGRPFPPRSPLHNRPGAFLRPQPQPASHCDWAEARWLRSTIPVPLRERAAASRTRPPTAPARPAPPRSAAADPSAPRDAGCARRWPAPASPPPVRPQADTGHILRQSGRRARRAAVCSHLSPEPAQLLPPRARPGGPPAVRARVRPQMSGALPPPSAPPLRRRLCPLARPLPFHPPALPRLLLPPPPSLPTQAMAAHRGKRDTRGPRRRPPSLFSALPSPASTP